jgi:hypothetical protein
MAVAGGWGKVLAAQQGSWQGGSAGLILAKLAHPGQAWVDRTDIETHFGIA